MRYFQKTDAARPATIGDFTFKFEPSHRNGATGGAWGLFQTEDKAQLKALSEKGRDFGIFEITADEYTRALQKKSTLNINTTTPATNLNSQGVEVAESKSDGETSSVDSLDELMSEGDVPDVKEEAPEPEVAEETLAEESEEKPRKRGRPAKN